MMMMMVSSILLPSRQPYNNLKMFVMCLLSLLLLPQFISVHTQSSTPPSKLIIVKMNHNEHQHQHQQQHHQTEAQVQSSNITDFGDSNNNNKGQTSNRPPPPEIGLHRFKRRLKSSKLPEFSAPIGNVTAVMGRDVRLICTVENLGQYQVAWLKEESTTILSIDTNIIITNYRIFLIPDEEERKWVLHIKDVQESDRGFYQCQVNTNPMRSTSGYLEVVVPPTIIESQSTRVAEVVEHSDVGLQCKANGHPRPTITWRRDDGSSIRLNGAGSISGNEPAVVVVNNQTSLLSSSLFAFSGQRLNSTILERPQLQSQSQLQQQTSDGLSALSQLTDVKSDKLSMKNVDRFMAGIYVCTASNGIPSQVSKRIPLYVKFPPKTSVSNKYISVSLGDRLEIDCIIEAFPKANSYWSKKSLSSLQDDRGQWGDGARLLHSFSSDRAPFHRTKQIFQLQNPSTDELEAGSSNDTRDDQQHHTVVVPLVDKAAAADKIKGDFKHQSMIGEINYSNNDEELPSITKQQKQQERLDSNEEMMTMVKQKRQDFSMISSFGGNFNGIPTQPMSQTISQQRGSRAPSSSLDQALSKPPPPPPSTFPLTKAYVSVRQTPLNTFTYKLQLSIAQMQPDDYGEYTCISTNTMGGSESKVMITRADKFSDTTDRQTNSDYRSLGEDDYERDSVADQARPTLTINNHHNLGSSQQQQQSSVRRGLSHSGGNRVVYDGNYLQAIKTRQSNLLGPNRMQQQQQNLKLKQSSDKNSAKSAHSCNHYHLQISVIIQMLLALVFSNRYHHHHLH